MHDEIFRDDTYPFLLLNEVTKGWRTLQEARRFRDAIRFLEERAPVIPFEYLQYLKFESALCCSFDPIDIPAQIDASNITVTTITQLSAHPLGYQMLSRLLLRFGAPAMAATSALQGEILAESLGAGFPERRKELESILEKSRTRSSGRKSVVLATLSYGGSTALDPVLRELLSSIGYDTLSGPHLTQFLSHFPRTHTPFYHWTHDGIERFEEWVRGRSIKIIILLRDPRDAIVSRVRDFEHRRLYPSHFEKRQKFYDAIAKNAICCFDIHKWLQLNREDYHLVKFDEVKADCIGCVFRILDFLEVSLDQKYVRETVEKYSFERITGRQRGAVGEVIRTGSLAAAEVASDVMYGTGTSGGWADVFDEHIKARFKRVSGAFLEAWGYQGGSDW